MQQTAETAMWTYAVRVTAAGRLAAFLYEYATDAAEAMASAIERAAATTGTDRAELTAAIA